MSFAPEPELASADRAASNALEANRVPGSEPAAAQPPFRRKSAASEPRGNGREPCTQPVVAAAIAGIGAGRSLPPAHSSKPDRQDDVAAELYRTLDSASLGTAIVSQAADAAPCIRRANRALERMLGCAPGQIDGSGIGTIFASDATYSSFVRHCDATLAQGRAYTGEHALRAMRGKTIPAELVVTLATCTDRARETVWLIRDISEKRPGTQGLLEPDQALERNYQALEQRVAERTAELSQQLHFLQQLIEAIPGPVFYKDEQARYLGCNRAFERYLGKSAGELIGNRPQDLYPGELGERYFAADRELLQSTGTQVYEAQVRYATGELREVMFHKATFTRPDGGIGGIVGVILDITERKRMEERLRQAATVFDSSAEGLTITEPNGSIVAINRAFTEITGYTADEVIGRNPRMFQSGRHDPSFYAQMWDSLVRQGRWQGEIWNQRKNGEVYPAWVSITAVRDPQGRLTNYVSTFTDIAPHKETQQKIQDLAFTDPLTGLPNRRLLLDRLEHALAVGIRSRQFGALFLIDLDGFKDLNDTRGHDQGDLLLQRVAQRLVGSVREGDTVARLGGDEFVVMLQNLGEGEHDSSRLAETIGEKLVASLNRAYDFGAYVYHGSASIGVTLFGQGERSVDELLKQADLAMYQAKTTGRNAIRFFDPMMQAAVAERVTMEAELRQGLKAQQFILHYQPKVDCDGRATGAEVLIRWMHPSRGVYAPATFIPIAEETGLIVALGHWVLDAACRQLAAWAVRPRTSGLTLAVNVSARQIHEAEFVDQVLHAVRRHGVDPQLLELELTETLMLGDVEDIIAKMAALKTHGVRFALDDFGTGYSSLAYLRRLPLDQLKIDRSFVHDVPANPNNAAIARTIVALAQILGLNVVAEGVETHAQFVFLRDLGCDAFQGYLFGRPLSIDDFERFVEVAAAC